ncbi:hypothetical protein FQN57_007335 [Myotisia sp. PD_48]|nr:hypothetical protein FQN57_007335 [Myotisia sp. PD_48]
MPTQWELQNSDATTEESDDDLGIPTSSALAKRRRARPAISPRPPKSSKITDVSTRPTEENTPKGLSTIASEGSGDDFNDRESAYQKFKNKKAAQRRKSAAQTRRSRKPAGNQIVGRRGPRKERKPQAYKLRDYGDDSSDNDNAEHEMPDHLQKRRAVFDRTREQYLEAGLRLPPEYEDVVFSDDERLEHLPEKPAFANVKPSRKYEDIQLPYSLGLIPAPIAQWLRDYQVEGVSFLHELFVYQKGGILGDDMGLGKTIQVIAFLTAAYGKTGDERDTKRMRKMRRKADSPWYPRTLIICPGTLLQNWRDELNRWGWWHVDLYHGDGKESALQSAVSGRVEILITTYTTYRVNKDEINLIEWDCVVADECHMFKEWKSLTAKSMNEVNALCRIGLTGTAIQNKYEELWTLLNWTNPGRFGPMSTWKSTICDPLKIGQSHDATVYQLSRARKTARKLVNNLLPPFFLRRMKSLIAHQLPKKSDRVVFCPLTETQSDAYENFLDSNIVEYIRTSSHQCHCGSGKKAGWCHQQLLPQGGRWQSYVFPAISNLQKLSNHVAILIPQPNDPADKQTKDLEMLQIAVPTRWKELYQTRGSILNYANPEFCGKWKVLKKLLKWWHANGDKVLVFSHSVRLLKMLQLLFNHTSYNVSYLDGAMNYDERAKVVDTFNSDPRQFVFLISTRAGGVGLNITSANKVVVVDPNWNPSYDLQAQDRAYRIGQLRDVEVFRLVSAGTIEEIVYARQIYKQQQANIGYNASTERRYFTGVQERKDQKGEIFGLANLFEYQNNNIVLKNIVNKTNVAESKAGVQVVHLEVEREQTGGEIERSLEDGQQPPPPAQNEEDDGTMSQLAALVRGELDSVKGWAEGSNKKQPPSLKHDPIQAILAGAGVKYTHENSEVVGSSKIEARLSRRAELINDGQEVGEEQVFRPVSQDGDAARLTVPGPDGKSVQFKYRPPPPVMKRQFCSMAKRFGFDDVTEFALTIESMTQAQRRLWLDNWYQERREILLGFRKSREPS